MDVELRTLEFLAAIELFTAHAGRVIDGPSKWPLIVVGIANIA